MPNLGTWPRGEGAYNLLWRSGRNSVIRDWIILYDGSMHQPERHHSAAIVTGSGGGRWYNYYDETYNREYYPSYRHLLVEGTSEPLHIYQCNPEHARCQSNMEIRNARNVTLHGVKGEGNYPIVTIRHSDNIRVFGYGGNAPPWPGTGLFMIEDSQNILIADVFDTVRLEHEKQGDLDFFAGPGVDPTLWYAIIEGFSDGTKYQTLPLERPVLYKRGTPRDAR